MKAKAALLGLCALLAACAAQAQAVVKMKPGLWETDTRRLKWEVDGEDMLASASADEREDIVKPKVERLCVSAAMVRGNLNWLIWGARASGDDIPRGACKKPKVHRRSDRMTFEMTCKTDMAVDGVNLSSGRGWGAIYSVTEAYRAETVIAPDQVTIEVKQKKVETKVQDDDDKTISRNKTGKPELSVHESQIKMKFLGNDCGDLWPQGKRTVERRPSQCSPCSAG